VDAMEAILTRRSIRKYTPEPVTEDTLKRLLQAAMSAPTANNQQPWHFVVIKDRKIMNEIPKFHHYSSMLKEAPLAILVCGSLKESLLNSEGYLVLDCTAATQNLLLAAHAEGLGAVWLGVYPRPERLEGMRRLLSLPDYVVPVALISLGHPAEKKPMEERYDPDKVHLDKW
jgi:nitroreductase